MQTTDSSFNERSIVIVGVGLIGGSIASAVRQRFPDCRVLGIGRNPDRLRIATQSGLLTSWSHSISTGAIPNGSLGIVCLPVDQIAEAVTQLLAAGCELVTDAGSVKASVYEALGETPDPRFIGSHPIAGSERSGFEHADSDLFVNRLCVVTPVHALPDRTERIASFWRSIGSTVQLMSPEEHDRVLALTSHLPHILASVTAGCVPANLLPFTGTGFRDTSRIAAGPSSLWTSILLGNAKHCVESITCAEDLLRKFRESLTAGDAASLEALWESNAHSRRQLNRD